ncbi:MAG: hypothetical protein JW812_03310 [Alphaproteobacteria bacterium]|nr:hypothetical protein [Alphaproteobacteria bacterium]MBN2780116.1 hypothetical protein [Alphaproteobacteria bacterium]
MKKILFYICFPVILLSACQKDENIRPETRFTPWRFANCESSLTINEGEKSIAELSFYLNETLTHRDTTYDITDTVGWDKYLVKIDTAGSLVIYYYDSTAITHTYPVTDQIPEYHYNLTFNGNCDVAGYTFEFQQNKIGPVIFEGPFTIYGMPWAYEDTNLEITTPAGTKQEFPLLTGDFHDACTDHTH